MSYFDSKFETEFKQVMQSIRRSTSTQFNLSNLKLEPTKMSDSVLKFVQIKGIKAHSVFKQLEGKFGYITNKQELSEKGKYAYSNKNQSLSVSKDSVLVAMHDLLKVPNNTKDIEDRITYLGVDVVDNKGVQYYAMSKDIVYPQMTYVVTISTKTVQNHFGGVSLLLTNARKIQIVIQDRSRIRATDAKSVYFITSGVVLAALDAWFLLPFIAWIITFGLILQTFITSSIEEARGYINKVQNYLIHNGFAFHPSLFEIVSEQDGVDRSYNLTKVVLEGTEDLPNDIIDFSLSQLEERSKRGVI